MKKRQYLGATKLTGEEKEKGPTLKKEKSEVVRDPLIINQKQKSGFADVESL